MIKRAASCRTAEVSGRSGPESGASAELANLELFAQSAGDARVGDLKGRKSPEALCLYPHVCIHANLFERSLHRASSQGKRRHSSRFKLESSHNIISFSFTPTKQILVAIVMLLKPFLHRRPPQRNSVRFSSLARNEQRSQTQAHPQPLPLSLHTGSSG